MHSSTDETEPEPDVVSSMVVDDLLTTEPKSGLPAAYGGPEKETEEPASLLARDERDLTKTQASPWTSAAMNVEVKDPSPIKKVSIAPAFEELVDQAEKVDAEQESSVEQPVEEIISPCIAAPEQVQAASGSTSVVGIASPTLPVEGLTVEEVTIAEKPAGIATPASKRLITVEEVTISKKLAVDATPASSVDDIVVRQKEEVTPVAASSPRTIAHAEGDTPSAWNMKPDQKQDTHDVEASFKNSSVASQVVKPAVLAAAVEDTEELMGNGEVLAGIASSCTVVSPEETLEDVNPWMEATMQKQGASVTTATPQPLEETPESVVETPDTAVAASIEPVPDALIEKYAPPTNAWNSSPVQERDVNGSSVSVKSTKQQTTVMVKKRMAPGAVVTEAEELSPTATSAWLEQEIKVDVAEVMVEKVETIQEIPTAEHDVDANEKNSRVAVKQVVTATSAVEGAKIDKKAIANAFDGVAKYRVDSITNIKMVPSREATAFKSAVTPEECGACGIGGCILQ
ncbi:hypothetical protein PsorP6_000307 [Peronosclerospora sorghi]|uniref:Uncharacterized protein n=1 Tax=Peronosclerospora sorghi TaxID=230839 RepID=A0ACC0WT71_9STRA|nr:hypothetical protein PsorP6_000307 [Peronosclerospora sorghi]